MSCLFVVLGISNFGFEHRGLVLTVLVPDHKLLFTFLLSIEYTTHTNTIYAELLSRSKTSLSIKLSSDCLLAPITLAIKP